MDAPTLRRLYLDRLIRHAHHHHSDNYSVDRYGPGGEGRVDVGALLFWQELIHDNLDELAWLWDALGDDESREVLLECMAYNSLGHLKVKRRLHTARYQAALRGGPSCGGAVRVEREDVHLAGPVPLHLYSLEDPALRLVASRGFILTHVINRHYLLERGPIRVAVDDGDVVLDCGACRGDTALWLAAYAGPAGRVHSFEFVADNLAVFRANLELNPHVATRVTIVEHANGATSGETLRFDPCGPGTRVGQTGALAVTTLSIDDHVRKAGLDRVDYIKMDIEGSEDAALRGAMDTIRRFHPKLGISAYHKPGDWWQLARRIRELNPRYRLYMDHHTIYGEETVLYATVG